MVAVQTGTLDDLGAFPARALIQVAEWRIAWMVESVHELPGSGPRPLLARAAVRPVAAGAGRPKTCDRS